MNYAPKPQALEFFAGGGLARLGLAPHFDIVWANDIDPAKAAAWIQNFGAAGFHLGDVSQVDAATLPKADLAWASFPCQDVSMAGARAGLGAQRSGSFYSFVKVIKGLQTLGRAPKVLVIENVVGLLSSHGGQDFSALMQALSDLGYQAGAVEIDARHFVPQSRPRVFIIACADGHPIPPALRTSEGVPSVFITPAILKAWAHLPDDLRAAHIWWALPVPQARTLALIDLVDMSDQNWWPEAKTRALIESLGPRHRQKLAQAHSEGTPQIGAVYRRTRTKNGVTRPFAEVRFDGLAGCLRTPSGGSSRQFLLFVRATHVRARALNAREAMRLMGVCDAYPIPNSAAAGLHIAGDGVAVPVVTWLSACVLAPLVGAGGWDLGLGLAGR